MSDKIKDAAQYLRDQLKSENVNVRSSHAHQAVAAYLGFNSKKALIDSDIEIDHDELFLEVEPDIGKIEEAVRRMKDTDLSNVPFDHLAETIQVGLSPTCEGCDHKRVDIQAIASTDIYDEADGWICGRCVSEMDDEYATCVFCGPEIIYRADQINHNGECPEHMGESDMDEEDEEDWDSYIENINKD